MDSDSESLPDRAQGATRRRWVLMVTVAACWLPLLVAAVALGRKGWTPVGEFAQAELRVRDFWDHPPDLGAVGRLRTDSDVSSHPGPATWWLAYPFYALGGRSAVALSGAVAASACVWIGAALGIAWRRAGDALTVLLGASLLALIAGLGPSVFIEPWNPWFALMAFVTLMVSAWAATSGSRWALVLATAAGTYCVQAHLGYAPLVALMGAVTLFGLWDCGPRTRGTWRPLLWPVVASVCLAAVMWLPPLLEQLTGDPGNIGIMISAYRAESGSAGELGLRGGLKLVAAYLDPWAPALLVGDAVPTDRGPSMVTVLFCTAWVATVVLAVLRRRLPDMRSALRMQVVVLISLLGAVFAASRIPGEVFGYLVLWLAAIVAIAMTAIMWTLWLVLRVWLRQEPRAQRGPAQPCTLRVIAGCGLAIASLATAVSLADPDPPGGELSDVAAVLVEQTLAELDSGGPLIVRWEDPAAFGALGTAVLSELERQGVEVGVDERLSAEMRPHRVLEDDAATGAIWVVSGDGIQRWRSLDGVEELAHVDPRTSAQRSRQAELAAEIEGLLEEAGVPQLAGELSLNAWVVRSDPSVGAGIDELIDEYVELGFPTSVFETSVGTPQPGPD